jgi:hypothetical protein
VNAGVTKLDHHYDPTKPYDEIIVITRASMIASFDEMRVNK